MKFNPLDLLLPREVSFFKYMNQQADVFNKSCQEFRVFMDKLASMSEKDVRESIKRIKAFETKGDDIEKTIIEALDITFITPLDREDIHAIVVGIDDSLDLVNDVSQKVELYQIKEAPARVKEFAVIISKMSADLKVLVAGLNKGNGAAGIIKNINLMEREADSLFAKSLAELFKTKDPIEIIKLKEIYEHLEETVDSINEIATLIRAIKVKHG